MSSLSLNNELLIKKVIKKTKLISTVSFKKKSYLINFFSNRIFPGMLLQIIMKPTFKTKTEYNSGICMAFKGHTMQSSLQLLNIILNMKILNIYHINSPIILLCIPLIKRKYLNLSSFNINIIKLYYLYQLKIKYLRTSIITKSILK